MSVRLRSPSPAYNSQTWTPAANEQLEQFMTPGLPTYTEMTRQGLAWSTQSTTAYAALVARPDTVAAVEIYNGNSVASNIVFVIDRIFAEWRLATAAASSAIMYASVGPQVVPSTPVAATLGLSPPVKGNNGKRVYGGGAIVAVDQTVADVGWFVWGDHMSSALAAATPNGGIDSRVEGRLLVRPGHALCLHVVASLVGDTFVQGSSWYETSSINLQ